MHVFVSCDGTMLVVQSNIIWYLLILNYIALLWKIYACSTCHHVDLEYIRNN